MGLAVVHGAALEIGIQLAGPVPVAGERADHAGVSAVARPVERLLQVPEAAPVFETQHFVPPPAHEAVNQHQGIVVAGAGRGGHQQQHQQEQETRQVRKAHSGDLK
jgi:hypothetical protein